MVLNQAVTPIIYFSTNTNPKVCYLGLHILSRNKNLLGCQMSWDMADVMSEHENVSCTKIQNFSEFHLLKGAQL